MPNAARYREQTANPSDRIRSPQFCSISILGVPDNQRLDLFLRRSSRSAELCPDLQATCLLRLEECGNVVFKCCTVLRVLLALADCNPGFFRTLPTWLASPFLAFQHSQGRLTPSPCLPPRKFDSLLVLPGPQSLFRNHHHFHIHDLQPTRHPFRIHIFPICIVILQVPVSLDIRSTLRKRGTKKLHPISATDFGWIDAY